MIPKFRIFDKQKNQMVVSAWWEFYFEDGCLLNVTTDLDVSYFDDELGERWELMQSTGLHDKNGKEIYEGDIVKFVTEYDGNNQPPRNIKYEIVTEKAVTIIKNNNDRLVLNMINDKIEIIGNIHEHSHLLDDGGQ